HQAGIFPPVGEAQVGIERALLAFEHLLEELWPRLGNLAVFQLLVQAAAALESALLHVLLPAGFRIAILERPLAAVGVEAEHLHAERVPAADAFRFPVLD